MGENPVGLVQGRDDVAVPLGLPQELQDARIGRPAVVVTVGEDHQVRIELERPDAQGLHFLLRVVAGDGEAQYLDRQARGTEERLQPGWKGILRALDPVAGGDAVPEDGDAESAGRLGHRVLAVPVSQAVALPLVLVELGGIALVLKMGHRLEEEAGIGGELKPAAADRCHLGRAGEAHQDLPAGQSSGEPEKGGQRFLLPTLHFTTAPSRGRPLPPS